MKKNKGFTLVELLAVITVIGIVLSIATTATVTIMNRGRKKSEMISAKDYVTAVNDYNVIADKTDRLTTTNCDCVTMSTNLIRCNVQTTNGVSNKIKESLSGSLPKSGTVDINTTTYKVVSARLKIKKYTVTYENSKYSVR